MTRSVDLNSSPASVADMVAAPNHQGLRGHQRGWSSWRQLTIVAFAAYATQGSARKSWPASTRGVGLSVSTTRVPTPALSGTLLAGFPDTLPFPGLGHKLRVKSRLLYSRWC